MTPKQVPDAWERGDSYERYAGRWSRRVAPHFLSWLSVPAGRRWLDVGSGTGALCTAILNHGAPASVAGVEPSDGFRATAERQLADRATFHRGDATHIPLADDGVDVTVSGLVLNFVPDARAALAEMLRVTAAGGTIGAYVWDYAGTMELMTYFWDAAAELEPEARALDQGVRFPLCQPEALAALFQDAGLHEVDTTAIDIQTPFVNFDDYWRPFLGGQGAAPTYVMSLGEAARARLRDRLRERIPVGDDASIALVARAWAVRGTVRR